MSARSSKTNLLLQAFTTTHFAESDRGNIGNSKII
jgi:hypothetical protein